MTKQEINKLRKYIKSRIKTMETGRFYDLYILGKFFTVQKVKNNLYGLYEDLNLLDMLTEYKFYTKHNLINTMINEIEKEGSNNE